MAEIKTKKTDKNIEEFIQEFTHTDNKRKESFELLRFIQEVTGFEPKMWGASIIGFGEYHYKSERSKQEGDWPLVGFSPRKAAFSLYVFCDAPGQQQLLKELGKFKMGKACIYVNKLADINLDVLKKMIESTISFLANNGSAHC